MSTFNLQAALVGVIGACESDLVTDVVFCTVRLVGTVVAVVFAVADARLIYALVVVADVHVCAIQRFWIQFIVIVSELFF